MRPKGKTLRRSLLAAQFAVLLTVPVALAGCSGTQPAEGAVVQTGERPNQDVLALPDDLDAQIEEAIAKLPGIAQKALQSSGVPGMAIAVVHGNQTVFSAGYGVGEQNTDTVVTADTVFQIASLSKPLSATGVAATIQASGGALDWNTPIHELLPGFKLSDPLVTERATIGDAFSHQLGLATGAGDDLEDLGYDRDGIVERLSLQPLDAFRSSYHYSNFGLTIGAEAVAAGQGMPWEQLMDDRVFTPLGMSSSSVRHDDFLAHDDRARLHAYQHGGFVAKYDRNPDAQSPAGGVSSTANDLARWMRMLLAGGEFDGKQIVDADALRAAMTAQAVSGNGPGIEGRPSHYGYGFNAAPQVSGRMAISHSGAFVLGAATNFQIVPSLDLGIVVLTNGAPVGVPEAVTAQFLDQVQYGHSTRDWVSDARGFFAGYAEPIGDLVEAIRPDEPAAPPPEESLVGVYDNPYFGPLTIEPSTEGLRARLGPEGVTTLELTPWDGPVFEYFPRSESAPARSHASATFGQDGASVTLDSFDGQGFGTWIRRS